ncbi:phytanoyl-CoA dioxygenase family protein [Sphingomonas daechungensis]|uniref:phytanoyl-CoA dioxygenase family protein n=1 Tax=Sphingomonas daechungensis TaxID=1176646 RepID=UPI0037844EC8
MPPKQTILKSWWRAPFWLAALLTGAKSFVDNPILGSRRLNAAGLHVWRLKGAHALARSRRSRLAGDIPLELREQFDRDGYVLIHDFLPQDLFQSFQRELLDPALECRSQQQGDTLTHRIPIGPGFRRRLPELAKLLDSRRWKGLLAYVASTRSAPLYYVQAIAGGVAEGPPDPQLELHADTFQPSMKAWLFLSDVPDDGRPLTYVAGSHRLSDARIAWEKRKSVDVLETGDRLSQRGSFRIAIEELAELGLPQPTHFSVPANTLVVVDTCGFHARAQSTRPTMRVELWAFSRRSPFLPWAGFDPLSWHPIAIRRGEWLQSIVDWLDHRGLKKQHWRPAGRWPSNVFTLPGRKSAEAETSAEDFPRKEMRG